ncbi:MAG: PH domain-containing protein [Methanomassiliicoccaceae archaeon]|nr:PH domain-containing protein [Methanomassiliicoccaceae archaeon]
MSDEIAFRSKLGIFHFGFVAFFVVLLSYGTYSLIISGEILWAAVFTLMPIFIAGFFTIAYIKVRYTFKEYSILIEGLGEKHEIKYTSIRGVKETREKALQFLDFRSGIIASYDLVRISYGNEEHIFISPAKREEFMTVMQSKLQFPEEYMKEYLEKERKK